MATSRRITKEFEDFAKMAADVEYGVSAELVGNDITHWKGVVKGPSDTSYAGGTFVVDI
jgi:ubiquitin-conjugating enzyme (huntingtin interacting protein 2)